MQKTHYNRVGLSFFFLLIYNVSVYAVEKVAINPASVTLTVGQSQKLTLTGNDFSTANKAVVYKGSKEDTNFTTGLSCKPPTTCEVEIKLGKLVDPGLYVVMLQNEKNQVIATAPLKIAKVNEDPKVAAAKAKAEAEKKAAEEKAKAEALAKQQAELKAKQEAAAKAKEEAEKKAIEEKAKAEALAQQKAEEEKVKAEQAALTQQKAEEEKAKQDAEAAKKAEASKQAVTTAATPVTDTNKAETKQTAVATPPPATPTKETTPPPTNTATTAKPVTPTKPTTTAVAPTPKPIAKPNQAPVVTSIEIPKDIKPGQKFKANITATDDEGVLALAVIYNKQKQPSIKSTDPKKQQNTFTIELTAPKSGEINIQAMALDSKGVKSAIKEEKIMIVEQVAEIKEPVKKEQKDTEKANIAISTEIPATAPVTTIATPTTSAQTSTTVQTTAPTTQTSNPDTPPTQTTTTTSSEAETSAGSFSSAGTTSGTSSGMSNDYTMSTTGDVQTQSEEELAPLAIPTAVYPAALNTITGPDDAFRWEGVADADAYTICIKENSSDTNCIVSSPAIAGNVAGAGQEGSWSLGNLYNQVQGSFKWWTVRASRTDGSQTESNPPRMVGFAESTVPANTNTTDNTDETTGESEATVMVYGEQIPVDDSQDESSSEQILSNLELNEANSSVNSGVEIEQSNNNVADILNNAPDKVIISAPCGGTSYEIPVDGEANSNNTYYLGSHADLFNLQYQQGSPTSFSICAQNGWTTYEWEPNSNSISYIEIQNPESYQTNITLTPSFISEARRSDFGGTIASVYLTVTYKPINSDEIVTKKIAFTMLVGVNGDFPEPPEIDEMWIADYRPGKAGQLRKNEGILDPSAVDPNFVTSQDGEFYIKGRNLKHISSISVGSRDATILEKPQSNDTGIIKAKASGFFNSLLNVRNEAGDVVSYPSQTSLASNEGYRAFGYTLLRNDWAEAFLNNFNISIGNPVGEVNFTFLGQTEKYDINGFDAPADAVHLDIVDMNANTPVMNVVRLNSTEFRYDITIDFETEGYELQGTSVVGPLHGDLLNPKLTIFVYINIDSSGQLKHKVTTMAFSAAINITALGITLPLNAIQQFVMAQVNDTLNSQVDQELMGENFVLQTIDVIEALNSQIKKFISVEMTDGGDLFFDGYKGF